MMTRETTKEIFNRALGCNKRLAHCKGTCDKCNWNYNEKELFRAIKFVAEHIQKLAYWKRCKNEYFKCSACGSELMVPTLLKKPVYKFCPCCGVEMEE